MTSKKIVQELQVDAVVENIETVVDFVDGQLEEFACSLATQMKIRLAIDEIFSNIAHYAYAPDVGPVLVQVEGRGEPLEVVITFIDQGIPYNPLAKEDPDVTLSVEERPTGGLGIYIVKKIMDGIFYEYKNGRNILKIRKKL